MDYQVDDPTTTSRRRRLVYTREQFDDYWVSLTARIRYNDEADKIISGERNHPLLQYQRDNAQNLAILRILPFTLRQLIEDPCGELPTLRLSRRSSPAKPQSSPGSRKPGGARRCLHSSQQSAKMDLQHGRRNSRSGYFNALRTANGLRGRRTLDADYPI